MTAIRRFDIPPNDPQFGRNLLDQLNRHTGKGQTIPQSLSDDWFSEYQSDPSLASVVYAPAFPCPPLGKWKLLEAVLVSSGGKDQAQSGPYFVVRPSLRIGSNTRALGEYSQRENALDAGTPFALLDSSGGVVIPNESVLETVVSQYGYPVDGTSIADLTVRWQIVCYGG